jgi:hypothetical protein
MSQHAIHCDVGAHHVSANFSWLVGSADVVETAILQCCTTAVHCQAKNSVDAVAASVELVFSYEHHGVRLMDLYGNRPSAAKVDHHPLLFCTSNASGYLP